MAYIRIGTHSPADFGAAFVAENATLAGSVLLKKGLQRLVWRGAAGRYRAHCHWGGLQRAGQCGAAHRPGLDVMVGRGVSIGHGAIVHGCTVGDRCLIGMHATILNGAVIGDGCLIAAGALVPENAVIPAGSLCDGCAGPRG